MATQKTTLLVAVRPDVNILTKLAADYERRATTHPEHNALYAQTGLDIDTLTSYFVTAIWRKARAIRLTNESSKVADRHLLQRLHFPAGICRHIMSIGNVKSAEYEIQVVEERIVNADEAGYEPFMGHILDDDQLREVSEKLYQLDSFMPTFTKQYKFDVDGDEAMFGIIDPKFAPAMEDGQVVVRTFTGKAIDAKYLEITAVLGLKPAGSNSPILYPNVTVVDADAIRKQFATGHGFQAAE